MNREEKRIVEGFRHWIDTNTERGVTIIPNSLCEKVYKLIVKKNPNIIEIPDNATNGEIYEKIFGYADEETKTVWNFVEDDYKSLRKNMFSKTWWNAPYKKGENNG